MEMANTINIVVKDWFIRGLIRSKMIISSSLLKVYHMAQKFGYSNTQRINTCITTK